MLKISELFIYPIKSLGGIKVSSAIVTEKGLQHDRRWMLVDHYNMFMTQRDYPLLALLQVSIETGSLRVQHKQNGSAITIPFQPQAKNKIVVQVWDDTCNAELVSEEADAWFSEMLSMNCRLVYMPDETRRLVEKPYAENNEITSFSDAYPFLVIGQSSLDDLNRRLEDPLPTNRFRPNIVFTGGNAFEEDVMEHFMINGIHFYGVKLCARCVITTIDQQNAIKGKEPLKTLATYRMKNNKVYFGQNLLHKGKGFISIGDQVEVLKRKEMMEF